MEKAVSDMAKYINTILLAMITMVVTYGVTTVNKFANELNDLQITVAVLSESVLTHNIQAGKYIEQIEDHETRIVELETGSAFATRDRMTKSEVLEALENLKDWVDENYERK